MKKFRDLEDGKRQIYQRGEYLFIWLHELKETCRNDKIFQREIDNLFENPEGVLEYYEKKYSKHKSLYPEFRNQD